MVCMPHAELNMLQVSKKEEKKKTKKVSQAR